MNKKISTIIWIIAIGAVLIGAYVIYSKSKNNIEPLPNDTTSESSPTSIPANDFRLKDLDGNTVNLSDYKGKVVILNFWATWCTYCRKEMPDLNELNKEFQENNEAVLLAIDVKESPDTVKKYLTSDNIDLKVLMDQDASVTKKYGVDGFPTTLILNKDGSIYTSIVGKTDKQTIKNYLDKMKNGEPAQ